MIRLAILLTGLCAFAEESPLLYAGRRLTAALKLDQAADNQLFDAAGFDRSFALLDAVIGDGQRKEATQQDWINLHRAVAGMVELHVHRGDLMKAMLYASEHRGFYRNLERDYDSALAASRLCLELLEHAGAAGADSLYVAHYTVGRDLFSLGRLDEALAQFRRAHEVLPGMNDPLSGSIWRSIVVTQIARKDLADAADQVRQFSAAASSAPPIVRARALMARSDIEIAGNKYLDAIQTIQQAQAVVSDPKDVESLNLDALNQVMSCVLAAMTSLPYDDALRLANRLDSEFPGVGPFAKQAIRHRQRLAGDFEIALREDSDRLEKARAAKDTDGQIEALRSMSITYGEMHAVQQEISLLRQALALEDGLLPKSGVPGSLASLESMLATLASLGQAYIDTHETAAARSVFGRMARILKAVPQAELASRLDGFRRDARLGEAKVDEMTDDPDAARDTLRALLKERPEDPWALLQLARLEADAKEKPARAVELYESAVHSFAGGQDGAVELAVRLELARFLATSASTSVPDALSLARSQLTSVTVRARSISYADAEWRVAFVEGILAEAEKDSDSAIAHYRAAVSRLEAVRAGFSQEEHRRAFMDSAPAQELYQRLVALLAAKNRTAEAWQYLEKAKARTFLEEMGGRRFRGDTKDSGLRDLETRIAGLRVAASPENAGFLRGSASDPAVLSAQRFELESEFTLARQQALLASSRTGQALALNPISLERTRKLLPGRTVLIEYALLQDSVAAFVVAPTRVTLKIWPFKTNDLKRQVSQLRVYLADARSGAQLAEHLSVVSKMVVEPLWSDLPAGVDRLLIVPADLLNYVPFQALPLPGGGSLIDKYTIAYLPSASTLEFLPRVAGPQRGSVFLGALGGVPVEGEIPLPGTMREADGIAKIYPDASRASEREFTHDVVRDALLRYDTVHLATHGFVDEYAPLFSAVLTVPSTGEPARFSLYEVMDLHLKARLVILSACETGLGKLLKGDEVAGLTRTFLMAGANTVVSSLWKVSDDSTAILMEGFHRRLRDGMQPARALRESALEVRKQFPHPYFWAPFVMTGAQ